MCFELEGEVVCQSQQLSKANRRRMRIRLSDEECVVDGFLVVGGDDDFSLSEIIEYGFEIGKIVFSALVEIVSDWIFVAMSLGQPRLLYDVCSPYQLGSKFQMFMFGECDLKVPSLDGAFEIVLYGRDDVNASAIVFFLQLLGYHFNCFLHVALLGINQNAEVVGVLDRLENT